MAVVNKLYSINTHLFIFIFVTSVFRVVFNMHGLLWSTGISSVLISLTSERCLGCTHGKPSLSWLQLWEMGNCSQLSKYFKKHARFRSKRDYTERTLDCVEVSWRDWNHAGKYARLALNWISASYRGRHPCSDIFVFIFVNTAIIIKWFVCFFCKFSLSSFRAAVFLHWSRLSDWRGFTVLEC